MKSGKLSIRPYARLLTMLGDQLIRNERIALVELIKNAYDADADWVKVRFEKFNEDMSLTEKSSIVVEDNGCGMTPKEIQESWMNPAAPQKYIKKKMGDRRTTTKNRIIQGEKGIGRFAILKLGNLITITTRASNSRRESCLKYDFTRFDNDFVEEDGAQKDIFLDEIKIDYSESPVLASSDLTHGTRIEIHNLKGAWSKNVIDKLRRDISSLTDPISRITDHLVDDNFEISIICNEMPEPLEDKNAEDLKGLIESKSVLKIKGKYDSHQNTFLFRSSKDADTDTTIELDDPKIKGLWIWKQWFREKSNQERGNPVCTCGSFKFQFYVFDFSRGISGKYGLSQNDKNMLKEHRIYLYRDGVRVYPYGDPEDDWLNIDVARGTGKAGHFFSNDQVIGWIDISQEHNPNLRDKTNREGLIEAGEAVTDFLFLIRIFLSYVKQYPYSRYQHTQRSKNVAELMRSQIIGDHLDKLKTTLEKGGHKTEARKVAKLTKEYQRERSYLVQRAETTEDLAGVGLSVEMTSHDILLMVNRAQEIGSRLAKSSRHSGDEKICQQADMLVGVLTQITENMKDIQVLFKSAKRRRKTLRIEPILDKISQLYEGLLEKRGIRYEKIVSPGSPLVADTTDGVIMQVLINLFDNAAYWLDTIDQEEKEIIVSINGDQGELVFSDNGPGIDKEDLPYIFEPFYSGKGQEGRGLGLYIARQLLERHDYYISVVEESRKRLINANFLIHFVRERDDGY